MASRWRTARRVPVFEMVLAAGVTLAMAAPASAQEGAPESSPSCLGSNLEASAHCPPRTVGVDVSVRDDHLVVKVSNGGADSWAGGPVAVEVPMPEATVDAPIGYEDPSGHPGTFEWVTRDGVVVSRCEFPVVASLAPGGTVTCRVARLGLGDGEHRLWLTGFIGASPTVGKEIDAEPAPTGVVPVAGPRSARFEIDGDHARVLDAGEAPSSPVRKVAPVASMSGDSRGTVVALGGLAAAAAAGLLVTFLARSRSHSI